MKSNKGKGVKDLNQPFGPSFWEDQQETYWQNLFWKSLEDKVVLKSMLCSHGSAANLYCKWTVPLPPQRKGKKQNKATKPPKKNEIAFLKLLSYFSSSWLHNFIVFSVLLTG